jgi:hypothetical protein
MASLSITKDQLVGANSSLSIVGRDAIIATQDFTFPGLLNNNRFVTPLGGSGEDWQLTGLLRSAVLSTVAAAVDELDLIIDGDGSTGEVTSGLMSFYQRQTLLNFLASDTSPFSELYQGSATTGIDNMVIAAGSLGLGNREKVIVGSQYRVIQPVSFVLRRLF